MPHLFERGSEWRKWDLHLHTPSSQGDYGDSSVTNEDIISALRRAEIKAAAITDHHTIDIKRIRELQRLAGDDITIFPGIEFRADKGGKEPIHFIGILPEYSIGDGTLEQTWTRLQGRLNLDPKAVKERGPERVTCRIEEASAIVHRAGGLITIHAGRKSNTIENITNALPHQEAIKEDILQHIDIFELGRAADFDGYKRNVYPHIQKSPPMILCSDNHNAREFALKTPCWIKADPTIQGLKQVLQEPFERVAICDESPNTKRIAKRKSFFIDSVQIKPVEGSAEHAWFNQSLPLNNGLVAIIGKKGSGKSALADTLGLLGQSTIEPNEYSFLHKSKFRKRGLADHYIGSMFWLDRKVGSVNLDQQVPISTATEQVKYLPQKYVESICNETGVSIQFQAEIDKVVFSYVQKSDRLGAASLEELISRRCEPIDEKVRKLRSRLKGQAVVVLELESKTTPDYIQSLKNRLSEKERELNALVPPDAPVQPSSDLAEEVAKKIDTLARKIKGLTGEIEKTENSLDLINRDLARIDNIAGKLKVLEDVVSETVDDIREDLEHFGLTRDDVLSFAVKIEPVDRKRDSLNRQKAELQSRIGQPPEILTEIDDRAIQNLVKQREDARAQLKQIRDNLDTQNRLHQEYLRQCAKIEEERIRLIGKAEDKGLETIGSLKSAINYVDQDILSDLDGAYKKLYQITGELYDAMILKADVYRQVYAPLNDFITSIEQTGESSAGSMSFDVGIVCNVDEFTDRFLASINMRRKGSFRTLEGAKAKVRSILGNHDYDTKSGTLKMLDEMCDSLRFVEDASGKERIPVSDQMVTGEGVAQRLYEYLFGLEYMDVRYAVRFEGKALNRNEFSPGEKGALLLIFYLLIDRDKCPLIIDQPEENLDNESVFNLLVPYIRKAKLDRQIVMVTHNPNLAVNCDADQVIHAEMDKVTNEIRYTSGSIENPAINRAIVNVLEGTMPAFRKRDSKYIVN